MAATNQNISVHAGDHLDIEVIVRAAAGEAVLPAGVTARYRAGDIISKTVGDGITISIEGDTMLLTIRLSPADTAAADRWQTYSHEVDITDAAGGTYTVLTGTLTVLPTLMPI